MVDRGSASSKEDFFRKSYKFGKKKYICNFSQINNSKGEVLKIDLVIILKNCLTITQNIWIIVKQF